MSNGVDASGEKRGKTPPTEDPDSSKLLHRLLLFSNNILCGERRNPQKHAIAVKESSHHESQNFFPLSSRHRPCRLRDWTHRTDRFRHTCPR